MKLSHLFVAALVASFALASSAGAATVPPSSFGAPLSNATSPGFGEYDIPQGAFSLLDSVVGYLAPNTKITFTYTVAKPLPYILTVNASGANSDGSATASGAYVDETAFPTQVSSTVAALPIIVTAGFNANAVGTTIIENFSSLIASFTSSFAAYLLSPIAGTSLHVDWVISSVPLPGAFLLFGSGLAALAGVGAHKRSRRS